ncbi:MAG: cysteine--tRNA ligase [Candidatus Levybacteria bacterium RIFCSPHIGHO2_01_FULL_37_33]|nr:MAG: cysteine--tRNA ligase [Candidatus Levybacteria bacterium RIFCSPHIGHO2_01_FULL_37_33]OGH16406.1 MAG: cysteine--tRNA ligase [Candidatus Levybacteria bacterium RIFCSPHIGHO2_02_FULL_37_11]OGH30284.1 MAG: cysteine--tRNA ligase [Candidatus Levybacteria bacterium RIFCSPHIGHO2_12_FULL_37_12]
MLKIYNTLARKIEEFRPIDPSASSGQAVGIYTCGPTVYREVHIGNFRTYIGADILRRVLMYNGFRVVHIKNITDVGHMRNIGNAHHRQQIDPIIEEALKMGKTPEEIAAHFTKIYLEDEKKLNILPATVYPKATDHIKEMIEIIKILISKGFAYEVGGTVYFDVKKFKNYGKLSGNTLSKMDNLLKAVRVSLETDKKDSIDFALWKNAEKDRLIKWDSPWGEGFPGWHIECSAMSIKYLGDTFDIHTGGEDLVFPHHEDEIAQSEAATGKKFANYWVHSGYLLVDNEKMSRSKGNVYTISDLEKKGSDPLSFRYLTLTVHYKSKMNFTFEALSAAQTALNNLREIVLAYDAPKIGCAEYEERFLEAINDDLNIPKALAIVWELVKSDYPNSAKAETLFKFDKVLGLDLENAKNYIKKTEEKIPENVQELIVQREELRKKKRYHLADQIRHKIKKMGYEIQDNDDGSMTIKKSTDVPLDNILRYLVF